MFLPQKLGIIFTKSAKQVLQKLDNTFPLENWTAFNKKLYIWERLTYWN